MKMMVGCDIWASKGAKNIEKKIFLNGAAVITAIITPKIIEELGQTFITVRSVGLNSSLIIEKSVPTNSLLNPLTVSSPTCCCS